VLVTRETDYAIRALRALSEGKKKTIAAICKEEVVPQQFGYKILKKLSKAGYVIIKRGKEGGYTISDEFKNKTLYDLTCVMENPMDISPCIVPGYRCEAHASDNQPCTVNAKLTTLQHELDAQLKNVNLSELFDEQRELDKKRKKK
jgi:Predicted transcriptional regulator